MIKSVFNFPSQKILHSTLSNDPLWGTIKSQILFYLCGLSSRKFMLSCWLKCVSWHSSLPEMVVDWLMIKDGMSYIGMAAVVPYPHCRNSSDTDVAATELQIRAWHLCNKLQQFNYCFPRSRASSVVRVEISKRSKEKRNAKHCNCLNLSHPHLWIRSLRCLGCCGVYLTGHFGMKDCTVWNMFYYYLDELEFEETTVY